MRFWCCSYIALRLAVRSISAGISLMKPANFTFMMMLVMEPSFLCYLELVASGVPIRQPGSLLSLHLPSHFSVAAQRDRMNPTSHPYLVQAPCLRLVGQSK